VRVADTRGLADGKASDSYSDASPQVPVRPPAQRPNARYLAANAGDYGSPLTSDRRIWSRSGHQQAGAAIRI
jgi:hypothetical protein